MKNLSDKITIKELAEKAGVSISTASRVINNKQNVNPDTRKKVEEAIAALNFMPDQNARGLRGVSSKMIALIIPDILNVYYTYLSKEIEEHLRKKGYTMLLGITNDDSKLLKDYLEKFSKINLDGIIYVPPPEDDSSPYVRSLAQSGIPVMEINRRRENDLFDGVEADNFGAVIQAMDHLYALGHRKIAFIVGSSNTTTGSQRTEAYKFFLNKHGIPLIPALLKEGSFTREFGEQAAAEILEITGENKPTAIFPTSNRLLMGTMKVLRDNQIHIPDEISVIALDDAEWLEVFEPSITTVDIAIEQMASLGVDLLISRIEGEEEEAPPRTYSLSTTLKIRNSCEHID